MRLLLVLFGIIFSVMACSVNSERVIEESKDLSITKIGFQPSPWITITKEKTLNGDLQSYMDFSFFSGSTIVGIFALTCFGLSTKFRARKTANQ